MTEETHDERQNITKDGGDSSWSDTSADRENTLPDVRRVGKILEHRNLFDRLPDQYNHLKIDLQHLGW